MAKTPRESGRETAPQNFAEVAPPRDLYATSDIRFVLTEIGKLTAHVEQLKDSVKSQGDKLDILRHQASFIKGAIFVSVGLIGILITVSSFFLSSRWDAAIQALRAVGK